MHRLRDEHGDLLGAGEENRFFCLLKECPGEGLRVRAGRVAVGIGIGQEGHGDGHRLERRAAVRQTGEAQGPHRSAVIGELACNRLGPLRLTIGRMPLAHELPCGLDGLATAIGEVGALHAERRGERDERLGELRRRGMGEVPGGGEGQRLQLARCGGSDFGAVGVAEVGAEEARQSVDEMTPLVADDLAALATDDDLGAGLGVLAHVGEVEEQVVAGLLADTASADRATLGSVHGSHIP